MADKEVSDTWERGSPYEQYVGRWSRRGAPLFLSWLNIPAGRRWLDVGCDTGALCAAIADRCSPASVAGAGLKGVEVKPINIPTPFGNFDDYWQPFLGGQGPAPTYAMSLDETTRARLRERIRERIPTTANGTISLTARAWAAHATLAR